MKKWPLLLAGSLFLTLIGVAADKPLSEKMIDGLDAKLLSDSMITSGVKKEEVAARGVPADHEIGKVPTRQIYRLESIVCKEQKCTPFTVDATQMKKIDSLFRKLGVEVTPAPKGQKNGKPILFVKEVICEAPASKEGVIICFATAHFKPKK